jgi:uncharacterized protein YcfJ
MACRKIGRWYRLLDELADVAALAVTMAEVDAVVASGAPVLASAFIERDIDVRPVGSAGGQIQTISVTVVDPDFRRIVDPKVAAGDLAAALARPDALALTRETATSDPKRVTGSVIGAVAGGVLGNQIGDGTGQTVATVAGAAAGGYAGSKVQKHIQEGKTTQTVEQRCRTVYDSAEKADGYEVRYRLGDQEGTVRMDHAPGRRIPVENGQLVLTDANDRG